MNFENSDQLALFRLKTGEVWDDGRGQIKWLKERETTVEL